MNKYSWTMVAIMWTVLIFGIVQIVKVNTSLPEYDAYENYLLDRIVIDMSFGSLSEHTELDEDGDVLIRDYRVWMDGTDYRFDSYKEAYRWLAKRYIQDKTMVKIWVGK